MKNIFDDEKPNISYPSSWEYKIMIQNTNLLETIIQDVLGNKEYKSKFSHQSKSGKYTSFNITVIVDNEEERLSFFDKFKTNQNISFVL